MLRHVRCHVFVKKHQKISQSLSGVSESDVSTPKETYRDQKRPIDITRLWDQKRPIDYNRLWDQKRPIDITRLWNEKRPIDINRLWDQKRPIDINRLWDQKRPIDINRLWDQGLLWSQSLLMSLRFLWLSFEEDRCLSRLLKIKGLFRGKSSLL